MLTAVVVGARPNFMKMAPVAHELRRRGLPCLLLHTGQHYDPALSQVFLEELGLPEPDVHLDVGPGSPTAQTARIMGALEPVLRERRVGLLAAGGDVTSTLAAALTASQLRIPVAHVEAGLRSFDRTMPEELNRILTDALADLLFTTEESADRNLRREGVDPARVHRVGNCMVDSLVRHRAAAEGRRPWAGRGLARGGYALATVHRPSNVDDPAALRALLGTLAQVAASLPVLFPVHPRTRERLAAMPAAAAGVRLTEPLPYLEFLGLMAGAALVLTDSGGIQEETTVLGVPCLTLRANTERPVTVAAGTNRLVGTDRTAILAAVAEVLAGRWPKGEVPPLWDGRAAERVVDVIARRAAAEGRC